MNAGGTDDAIAKSKKNLIIWWDFISRLFVVPT